MTPRLDLKLAFLLAGSLLSFFPIGKVAVSTRLQRASDRESVMTLLQRNEELVVNDLVAAKNNSESALALAQQIQDLELFQAAKLDWDITTRLVAGTPSDQFFNGLTLGAIDRFEADDPRLKFHKCYMVAMATIIHSHEKSELRINLEEMAAVARQSKNPDLIKRHKCLDAFARSCFASQQLEKLTSEDIREFVETMPDDRVWDCNAIVILLRAGEQQTVESDLSAIDGFIASPTGPNALLKTQLLNAKAISLLRAEDYDSSISAFEQARRIGRGIHSPVLNFEMDRRLIGVKSEFGKTDDLIELQLSVHTNPIVDHLSVAQASDTMKWIDHSLESIGEPNLGHALGVREPYPRHVVQRAKNQTAMLAKTYDKMLEERRESEVQLRQVEANSQAQLAAKASTLAKFQTYSIFATIAVLALLPWLFLLLQQARLSKVRNRLATEYQRAIASEAKVDGLTSRLNRIERMHSLGLMAGGIAHDFNNLLVGIMGNAELIQMMGDQADQEFVGHRVASIHESAEKAADIARNMLAYSGRHPIERRESAINDLVSQLECVLVSACLPSQKLVLSLCQGEIVVSVDRTMAERALLNLVKNASQFSPREGSITIRTATTSHAELKDDSSCFGESAHQGDFAVIEVLDFGNGISEAEREHIFEPFYSTTDNGRGLGLAVVYGFVKSHNGLVQCLSSAEYGTRFRIMLPLVDNVRPQKFQDRQAMQIERGSLQDIPQGNGKTVLLIDDDIAVLELCRELLELTGWNVIVAESGRDGLETMSRLKDEIDCVLLDIVMPDMSGGEVLNEMEAQKIATPVVLTSGFSKIHLEAYYARSNVSAIISKPFHNKEVVSALVQASGGEECSKESVNEFEKRT